MDLNSTLSRHREVGTSDEEDRLLTGQLSREDKQSGSIVEMTDIPSNSKLGDMRSRDDREHLLGEQVPCLLQVEEGANELVLDIANGTRYGCIAAIAIGIMMSLCCFISGTYILGTQELPIGIYLFLSSAGQEASALAINIVLALCTDGMMFVHSVSLRWALYREKRLEFNTNMRLFTSSREFGPNRWYINLIALFCLILTYGGSSVLFVSFPVQGGYVQPGEDPPVTINASALLALGIGLLGQAVIAIWCIISDQKLIPTWSSNPLNTALAMLLKGDLIHRTGRCMHSVHQRHTPEQPMYPVRRQGNIYCAQRIVRWILAIMWTLAVLAVAWPIIIICVLKSMARSYNTHMAECWKPGFDWSPNYSGCSENTLTLGLSPDANREKSNETFTSGTQAVLCVLFICLIQSAQTIVLHSLELLVNISRDEGIWRQAYHETNLVSASGTQRSTDPFRAAASSWENIVQFISKAVLHWIIGQSLTLSVSTGTSTGFSFHMIYSRLIIYAILAIFLAAFGTYLALKRPRGCQPASLGHLQTLVDLIDNWKTDEKGRMWWGDKTWPDDNEIRHAGTSCKKEGLGPIRSSKYAGGSFEAGNHPTKH